MTSFVFTSAVRELATGEIDFSRDSFGVILADPSYEPDRAHSRRADIDEASGEGYTSGGKPVAVKLSSNSSQGLTEVELGGATWPVATIRSPFAIYYRMGDGDPNNEPVIALIDFATDVVSINAKFELSESTIRMKS